MRLPVSPTLALNLFALRGTIFASPYFFLHLCLSLSLSLSLSLTPSLTLSLSHSLTLSLSRSLALSLSLSLSHSLTLSLSRSLALSLSRSLTLSLSRFCRFFALLTLRVGAYVGKNIKFVRENLSLPKKR